MNTPSHDVILVGGGGAGLRAAIAIAEVNPRLRIAVVSKVYPMRSHTVSAEGGAAAVIGKDDSLDEHAYDTISGGDWLCDQDAVEAFVDEAPKELLRLEHWGCPWSREPDGRIAVRPFGGMKKRRTWFGAEQTGVHKAARAFPDLAQVPERRAIRRMVRDPAPGRRGPRAGRGRHRADVGTDRSDYRARGDSLHGRLRPCLSLYDQREHQEWRRDGP